MTANDKQNGLSAETVEAMAAVDARCAGDVRELSEEERVSVEYFRNALKSAHEGGGLWLNHGADYRMGLMLSAFDRMNSRLQASEQAREGLETRIENEKKAMDGCTETVAKLIVERDAAQLLAEQRKGKKDTIATARNRALDGLEHFKARADALEAALRANIDYTLSLQQILKARFPDEQVPEAEDALFQKAMLLARAALSPTEPAGRGG